MESAGSASEKAGLPPGTLVHVGKVLHPDTQISIISFDRDTCETETISDVKELLLYKELSDKVTWINVEGLSDVTLIEDIGKQFKIHPLILEDILNTHQRPKAEEYADCLYMVAKVIQPGEGHFTVVYEQISILLYENMIISFKERQDEIFGHVKAHLKNGKGAIRNQGADYLAYVILDAVVDRYFSLQDVIDEVVDELEEELLQDPVRNTLIKIQRVKRELIYIRRAVSPQRDMLGVILHRNNPLIHDKTMLYFRDVYDHVLRVSEAVDSYREIMTGLLDIYVSSVSNKMNEVMKVLTLFASIFIPLTFLTGIYGMNFVDMPELKLKWAYPVMWVLFIVIPLSLVLLFKKKKWL
jgi:magnesium transporter